HTSAVFAVPECWRHTLPLPVASRQDWSGQGLNQPLSAGRRASPTRIPRIPVEISEVGSVHRIEIVPCLPPNAQKRPREDITIFRLYVVDILRLGCILYSVCMLTVCLP